MLLLAAALAFAVPASAQHLFDFNGQTIVPATVGGALSMNAVVYDAPPAVTPIPLDFANYEYTLVITGLTLDVDGMTQVYSGGTIALYEDNGSSADFANPGSFVDGTALMTGDITSLNRTMFTPNIGTVAGSVNWTGGTRVNELAPEELLGWPLLSGINAMASQTEPGYDENWDGKTEQTVSNQVLDFGELKNSFR